MTNKKTKISLAFLTFFLIILLVYIIIANQSEKIESYPTLYLEQIKTAAQTYDLEPELILAIIRAESNFNRNAKSPVGAMGLMQMMPQTFTEMQERRSQNLENDSLYDPTISIDYGCYFLNHLFYDYSSLKGEEINVIASYNAGFGKVREWLDNPLYSENGVLLVDKIPYTETRKYVKSVLSSRDVYREKLKIS